MASRSHGYRLDAGGLIDRTRSVSFTFNGRDLKGHPGDTLASALIANGINIIGRSLKFHRPRSFFGVGSEDPNSMLAVRDRYGFEPALRAGQVQLCSGLKANSVTGWPSPEFDVAASVQLIKGMLSAGFYYKTFMWPSWRYFEPMIRRSTGFGRPKPVIEFRKLQYRHATCDVLIIGGGPAGLSAARSLAGNGTSVVMVDDQPQFGGSLNWETATIDGLTGVAWVRTVVKALGDDPNFTLLSGTTVAAAYEGNQFILIQQLLDSGGVHTECLWKLRASHVVLASGMVDRPLLFAGNDRPGIMLSSATRRLIGEFGVTPARHLAIYTNNDSGYLTAIAARRAGVDVVGIIDTRAETAAMHVSAARDAEIPCLFECQIESTTGYKRVTSIEIRSKERRVRRMECSGVAVSGGFTPLIHLATHRGVQPTYVAQLGAFLAGSLPEAWYVAGGVAGATDLETALSHGAKAAVAIGTTAGIPVRPKATQSVTAPSYGRIEPEWKPRYGSPSATWVDFQNDVKVSDVELAARENYVSIEHLKRYTTLGMGTDQGRTSNVNGLAIMAGITRQAVESIGTTTSRPPYTAIRMDTIASNRRGDLFKPRRFLPAHAVHEQRSAVFEDSGWQRPDWYGCNGRNREDAVTAEMQAVRTHVGVFDGSSLGKIEVTGPDAAQFISRFYVSNMATLTPGRMRYSVMLKENGVIYDDGVVACVAVNHFLASPTSSQAEAVAAWFEQWRQTEWPSMRVGISPVTSNWATIAIAGPRARELLAKLKPNFDLSNEAFAHMQFREGLIGNTAARIARISFTGELQYEVSVPARYAPALLEVLLATEANWNPCPVGTEAWLRLRLEKGYLHLGSDTNGRTTPLDIGMAGIVTKRTDDFIGKRSLRLASATSEDCEQLVGLRAFEGILQVGGRVLSTGYTRAPCPTDGYVTSACFSPSVGSFIGLALIERGQQRLGETVLVYCSGTVVSCEISIPGFYDPDNRRLHA
jgi:sarcosine oxidase subunit alpha